MDAEDHIELEGVRVHNLRNISLQIRRFVLTVVCGVSGSGKSSLAFDTLFAEGQRRYIETFSPGARLFLDRIERPAADRIEGIPPAVAIRQNQRTQSLRSTVGTRTEILDYLRLIFVRAGIVQCPDCNINVTAFTAESSASWLLSRFAGRRVMIAFRRAVRDGLAETDLSAGGRCQLLVSELLASGFTRIILGGRVIRLDDGDWTANFRNLLTNDSVVVLLDRLRISEDTAGRLTDSLQTAMLAGESECLAWCEPADPDDAANAAVQLIDGIPWEEHVFSSERRCRCCGRTFPEPAVEMLNFNSPAGACATCEGIGSVSTMTLEKVVPDGRRSIREGAIQPWTAPAYRHELDELMSLAPAYGIPTDIPFADLTDQHRLLILEGVPESRFGGLHGFHQWLLRHRHRMGVRAFLNRWRSWLPCGDCGGSRLNSSAACVRLQGLSLSEATQMEMNQLSDWIQQVVQKLSDDLRRALRTIIDHLVSRIDFLNDCGLGYLTLNRSLRSLSGGEVQRVMLTAALGSGLINTLYVLDEPTSGLHHSDTQKVILAAQRLKVAGNTLVVVEHDPQFIAAADEVVEIGPGAGEQGGRVIFQGTPQELLDAEHSPTGQRLRSSVSRSDARNTVLSGAAANKTVESARSARLPENWLSLEGVSCNNLENLDVRLPLGAICAVTGVSGSGKSSLIVDSLYPELCRALGQFCNHESSARVSGLKGFEAIDQVLLLDQSPLQKSSRSVPVTWIGVFDRIRRLLAETHEGRKRNLTPASFSFNSVRGGRCPVCEGLGTVTIEMQFLADILTSCEECGGRRYRPDILEVRYRDRSVHDILEMTADDSFSFFSGHHQIQQRLNAMRQSGLGYLRLGQSLATLSGGEAQRLRLAALLAGVPLAEGETAALNRRPAAVQGAGRILFLLDEPSTGLHMQDIDRMLECLRFLVQTGHSVLLIEHDEYLLSRVDYQIELGPGAGRSGGRVIRSGAPG